ncbi:MAG: Hsp20/alpha crystallin family protein [Gammaproteobacteria bacterium]
MYESLLRFPTDLFAELERLQREMQHGFGGLGLPSSIRAVGRGAFPAINIGSTPTSIQVDAFAPGIDPAKLSVSIDRGLLTIAGERASDVPEESEQLSLYAHERATGPFKRVVSLPEDADPARVEASYRDGVVRIVIQRKESAQPRRIEVK